MASQTKPTPEIPKPLIWDHRSGSVLAMQFQFLGGPYNGMRVSAVDCRRVCPPTVVVTDLRCKGVLHLPSLDNWPLVLDGLLTMQDSEESHAYTISEFFHSGSIDGSVGRLQDATYDGHLTVPPTPPTCPDGSLASRLGLVRADLYGEAGADQLARSIGLPARTWSNYEAGVLIPGKVLLAFIVLTSVEPGWLLTGAGPRYRASAGGDRPETPSFRQEG